MSKYSKSGLRTLKRASYLRFASVFWAFSLIFTASFGSVLAGEYKDIEGAAVAINLSGYVVGNACFQTPTCSGSFEPPFLLSPNGTYSVLNFPLSSSSLETLTVTGINPLGDIVGFYLDENYGQHGFLLRGNGAFTNIDAPGASPLPFLGTTANGINAWGDIVGQYFDSAGVSHDFLLRNGAFINFIVPISGSTGNTPNGINALDEIVGSYIDSSGSSHGFLLSKSAVKTIDFPGAASSDANGINLQGDIVGSYTVPVNNNPYAGSYSYGFLLRRGTFTTINPPGPIPFLGTQAAAYGINDLGAIVGGYYKATGPGSASPYGFLLTR
jgi:hypothetical protein